MSTQIEEKRAKWREAVAIVQAARDARELALKAMNAATEAVTRLSGLGNALEQNCKECWDEFVATPGAEAEKGSNDE